MYERFVVDFLILDDLDTKSCASPFVSTLFVDTCMQAWHTKALLRFSLNSFADPTRLMITCKPLCSAIVLRL